jgi:hypothetical protein
VINEGYKKFLLKEGQSLTLPNQFLCQLSNISECLLIKGQDNVSKMFFIDQQNVK